MDLFAFLYVYDPQLGRSRKKSGKILGSITKQGLVPSGARHECVNPVLNDVVEVGAVNYIYQRTEWMRSRLQKHFPDLWEAVYVAAVIRAVYDCRFRRLQLHYEDSILSYLYPGLSFMPNAVAEFLNTLGQMRGAIRSYMQEMVAEHERFLLFDGHRLLSAFRTVDNAECGYDSRMRYRPQINLLNYVIPLKRGNRFVKGHVPASPSGYEEAFSFNGRGIHSLTISDEDFNIHLFLDTDLLSQEIADITKRTEKKNNAMWPLYPLAVNIQWITKRRQSLSIRSNRNSQSRLTTER